MIEDRTKILAQTIEKLLHRDARQNIQKVFLKTHSADIAAVLESFSPVERFDLYKLIISIDERAKVMSHFDEETQKEMSQHLESEELLEVARLMESDDLADFLGHLDEDMSKSILKGLDTQDSEDVADLMGYPEDSAGGIMSSDFLALDQDFTVEQTIAAIQSEESENAIMFYIYVVNNHDQLLGVLSLKELLLSRRDQVLKDLMIPDVLSVAVSTDQEDVAKMVERYDFLSIPVVEEGNKLVGVVTVDDVIDVIREEAEEDLMSMGQAGLDSGASVLEHFRARIPWLIFSFLGGFLCFVVIQGFLPSDLMEGQSFGVLAALIPLVLTMGATSGSQSATTAMTALRMNSLDRRDIRELLTKELLLSLYFAGFFALSTFLVVYFGLNHEACYILAGAIAFQIVISMMIGGGTPILIESLGLNSLIASVPIFTVLADVSAMLILFGSVYGFGL